MPESLYRLDPEAVLCVLCRRPNPTPDRSACAKCIPPDEGEVIARGRVDRLKQALSRLACFAATCQNENTREWMDSLEKHLNESAVTLDEPTQFVLRRNIANGHMYFTAEQIP